MAELSQGSEGKKKGGKVRAKKASTRIDMTPMVDLAFLLLTFFVMTTTLNKPQTMEVTMPEKPKKGDEAPLVNEAKVLTLILGEQDRIYWYKGITEPEIKLTDFSKDGVRKVLVEQNASVKGLVVLIKPSDKSRYKNVVDILDEMTISNMARYALVDITPEDEELVKASSL